MKKEKKSLSNFDNEKLDTANVKGGFAHTKGSMDGLGGDGDIPAPSQDGSNTIAAKLTGQGRTEADGGTASGRSGRGGMKL